jgi:hypothetical protein
MSGGTSSKWDRDQHGKAKIASKDEAMDCCLGGCFRFERGVLPRLLGPARTERRRASPGLYSARKGRRLLDRGEPRRQPLPTVVRGRCVLGDGDRDFMCEDAPHRCRERPIDSRSRNADAMSAEEGLQLFERHRRLWAKGGFH